MREVWVAGYPSPYGGADTELDHLIDLWRAHDVSVDLVPMFGRNPEAAASCEQRGCRTHDYAPGIFAGRVVVSFCNGEFLAHLPEIMAAGPPRAVVWFNCMTWLFPRELEAHQSGWISHFGFQSRFQRELLLPQLREHNPVQELADYRAYFTPERVAFACEPPEEAFRVGRISRSDPAKFSPDMWRIFAKVCAPRPVKCFVLGYSDQVAEKTGPPPRGLDYQWWGPGGVASEVLYARLHALIHKTGGSRENWSRVVLEAMAHGVPVIAERDYGLTEMIVDGETGFLCDSSDEMSYRASQLAFDEPLRQRLARNARAHLETELAGAERCWAPWERLLRELG